MSCVLSFYTEIFVGISQRQTPFEFLFFRPFTILNFGSKSATSLGFYLLVFTFRYAKRHRYFLRQTLVVDEFAILFLHFFCTFPPQYCPFKFLAFVDFLSVVSNDMLTGNVQKFVFSDFDFVYCV